MRIFRNIFFILALMLASLAKAQTELHVVPVVPMSKPMAGHYAGIVNDELWTWGGFNYTMTQYRGVIPKYYPQAYGASVSVPQGAVCLGGAADEYVFAQAIWQKHIDHRDHRNFCNQYDHSGRVNLTAMPVQLKYLSAAWDGEYIYAVGGESDSCANTDVYRLAWPDGKVWEKLTPIPDKARLQSVAVVQNSVTGPCLYVFGGYQAGEDASSPVLHRSVLRLNLRSLEWESLPVPDSAQVPGMGATGVSVGFCSVVFIGGKDLSGKCEDKILVYNTYTDTWSTMEGNPSFARCYATLTPCRDYFYLAGGETQKDTFTDDISVVQFLSTCRLNGMSVTVLCVFLLALLVFAWLHRTNSRKMYFLGDENTPWWAIGMSLSMTILSTISLILIPTASFASSWSSLWFYLPLLFVVPLAGRYFGNLWIGTEKTSVYDKLGICSSACVRRTVSVCWMLFILLRAVLLLALPAYILYSITGISPLVFIFVFGLFAAFYATVGGMKAIVGLQTLSCIVLLVGMIILLITLITGCADGLNGLLNSGATKFSLLSETVLCKSISPCVLSVCGLLYAIMLMGGDQTVWRHYGLNTNHQVASRGFLFAGVLSVLIVLVLLMVGTGMFAYFASDNTAFDITLNRPECVGVYYMLSRFPSLALVILSSACVAPLVSAVHSFGLACASDFSFEGKSALSARLFSLLFSVVVIVLSELLISLL